MMEKRVVLFGAGASYGAREPSPPLGNYLHQWVLRYFDKKYDELGGWEQEWGTENVRQALRNELKKTRSYETLANTLWKKGQRVLLTKLNFLLAASMTPPFNIDGPHEEPRVNDSFVEEPDVYDEWLKSCVKKADRLKDFTFITLNYDCLLERALCRTFFTPDESEGQCLCTHIQYPFIGVPRTGVEVLKLHGSINWIGILDGGSKSLPISIDVEGISTYPDIEVVPTSIGKVDDHDPSELIIEAFAEGKPSQANPQLFQDIKKKAMERISEAQKIEIIGVHIPKNQKDDPTLWDLFEKLKGKNVDFINPNEKENKMAKISFGFNPIKKSFKEYIDSQT